MKNNYLWLMNIRPAFLGSMIKKILCVKREFVVTPWGEFYIDPVSNFGSSIIKNNYYEMDLLTSLKDILKEGDTFIDLGANEGFFSIVASKIVGNKGQVVSIEPQSRLQKVITRNIEKNHAWNVGIFQRVISDSNGIAILQLAPDMNTGSSGIVRMTKYMNRTEEVIQLRLVDFIEQLNITKIDLLKIDIEGFEYEAVLGSKELFESGIVKNIALELHPLILKKRGKSESVIVDFLISVGYSRNGNYTNFIMSRKA